MYINHAITRQFCQVMFSHSLQNKTPASSMVYKKIKQQWMRPHRKRARIKLQRTRFNKVCTSIKLSARKLTTARKHKRIRKLRTTRKWSRKRDRITIRVAKSARRLLIATAGRFQEKEPKNFRDFLRRTPGVNLYAIKLNQSISLI